MTNEEKEVIEAAKAWIQDPSSVWALFNAIRTLPKPYESLVTEEELESVGSYGSPLVQDMREAIVLALRRMSKRLADNGYVDSADVVEGTANQEGEYNV